MITQAAPIVIGNTEIIPLFYQGQAVITLAMMDKVHSRPEGTAGRNFRQHRDKMIEGEDFYLLEQPDEIRRVGLAREDGSTPASITLLTETGYLLLVKSFTDDLAWQIQRQLVKAYFSVKRQTPTYSPVADERFTANDTANVSRVVWCISHWFRQDQAWVQGTWRELRQATQTPSPQRFRVADVPVIVAELRRLWIIAEAARAFIREAETAFLKRAVRNHENIEALIAEQRALLAAALQSDTDTFNGVLQRWDEKELQQITDRSSPAYRHDYDVDEDEGLA